MRSKLNKKRKGEEMGVERRKSDGEVTTKKCYYLHAQRDNGIQVNYRLRNMTELILKGTT